MNDTGYAGVLIQAYTRGLSQHEVDTRDDLILCDAEHTNVPAQFSGLPVYHLRRTKR